jgi:hypothetical protein
MAWMHADARLNALGQTAKKIECTGSPPSERYPLAWETRGEQEKEKDI